MKLNCETVQQQREGDTQAWYLRHVVYSSVFTVLSSVTDAAPGLSVVFCLSLILIFCPLCLFKVMRIRPHIAEHPVHLSFTEHQRCYCR